MSAIGIFGILLGFLALPFSSVQKTRKHYAIFFVLALVHLLAAFYYHSWAQTNTTDSTLYYFDDQGFAENGFALSTQFVIYFVQSLRSLVGGSYLDYFLLFQATGTWALAFIMRIIEEIYMEVRREPPFLIYALLFVPSFTFFTTAIGKDGPLALAVAMAVWSAMSLRRRLWVFALAVGIMVLFRPHIALIAMVAFAGAALLDPRVGARGKFGLGIAAALATGAIAATVRRTFAVDVSSAESLADFFARQSETSQRFDTGTAVLNASYPVRLLSLLFRPLFVDADTMLAYIASLENLFGLVLVALIIAGRREALQIFRRVFFVRFAMIFGLALTLLLAAVYYNVGLGMRQRTMLLPAIVAFVAALLAVRRWGRSQSPAVAPALA